MTDAPSKAAIKKAFDLAVAEPVAKAGSGHDRLLDAFARYIDAHEPQVDPDLATAREAVAQMQESLRCGEIAQRVRDGLKDNLYEVQLALAAIKLSKERGE